MKITQEAKELLSDICCQDVLSEMKDAYSDLDEDRFNVLVEICDFLNIKWADEYGDFENQLAFARKRATDEFNADVMREVENG